MDVIVLGAGLMGTSAAFFLARRGLSVTLVDRGPIGAGATTASFGNIRRTGRFLPQLPLAHRSRALWAEAESLLGHDVEFRATGHLRLIFDTASQEDMRRFAEAARPWGLDIEELGAEEVRRQFPGLGADAIGASFSPRDGSANPRLVSPAFAAAAERLGARVMPLTQVRDISRTESGFSLRTNRGVLESAMLLNCAGAWGKAVAAQFGEDVPLTMFGPQMAVTEPLPHRILPVVGMWSQDIGAYLRQVERGNIVFGGGVARVPVDPETGHAKVDHTRLATQLHKGVRLLPALRDVAVIRQWSGCEGYVADDLPVMGPSGTTPGLFHAFGFCGHGFQLGPGVGDAMAELIATGSCETPLTPFDIRRFAA
ncbi:FAD-binding oxidoreductase [Mameliella sp. CS4]|uniref:NAD(P)/FAD-dependent oxidoreductase n=1 Tax=Mameliella sp. CS4 TaxID=2862329 RepID=UPI001C5D3077|nr:FAD-binding oxidoreductase [uncultured Mameliella sp.]MBW4984201.1 FAD-binding oxidoreductase [Mameliella sp. CS4]